MYWKFIKARYPEGQRPSGHDKWVNPLSSGQSVRMVYSSIHMVQTTGEMYSFILSLFFIKENVLIRTNQ